MATQQSLISPVMRQLSGYIAVALRTPLPDSVAERTKIHLVDTFAAMISGTRLLPGKIGIAFIKSIGGKREAGVIGTRIVTSAQNAAFANGMSAHADETDDLHPPTRTHPGAGVVPAVLATGEKQRISGTAALQAMALGYDVCTRTILALAPGPLSLAPGKTVNAGFGQLFGAAAASAAILKLNAPQIRYVLAYAAQQAAGLYTRLRDTSHIEKAYAVGGMPAQNGILSALMVKQGFKGVDDVFSGDYNFFLTYSLNGGDPDALCRGLGKDYEVMRCGIKYWSAGGPIQGPLHVLYDTIKQHGLTAESVQKLVVKMPDKELSIVNNRENASISVQHLMAVMLLDGTLTFAASHDIKRMKDREVLALRKRIETVGDSSLTDLHRRWRCAIEVNLKDGRKLTHQTMAAKGGLDNPLTRQEQAEKGLDLMGPILGKARARALMDAIWNIETVKDVGVLRRFYDR